MPSARVFDVRTGLTQEVLDGLRTAQRVTLAVKGRGTAALGYWTHDGLNVALIQCNDAALRYVPAVAVARPNVIQLVRPPASRPRGIVLDIPDTRDSSLWSRLLAVLREGDALKLDAESQGRYTVLFVEGGGVRLSIRLPRASSGGLQAAG